MKCDKRGVPLYLHWNYRKVFDSNDFLFWHKLYRLTTTGNPIEIPAKWINAISCKWSKKIKKKDILIQPDTFLGDDYCYTFVQKLENYQRISVLEENHQYKGTHKLTCVVKHAPLACDYSHCEILIRHQIFRESLSFPFFDETYTYKSWEEETAMLKKMKTKFFKEMKSQFRIDMIKIFANHSNDNTIKNDVLHYTKMINIEFKEYYRTLKS